MRTEIVLSSRGIRVVVGHGDKSGAIYPNYRISDSFVGDTTVAIRADSSKAAANSGGQDGDHVRGLAWRRWTVCVEV